MGLSIENSINTAAGTPDRRGTSGHIGANGVIGGTGYGVRAFTAFTLLASKRCSLRKTRRTRKGLVDETLVGKRLDRFDLDGKPSGLHFRAFRVFRSFFSDGPTYYSKPTILRGERR
jgi:hypothetical protein